MIGNPIGTRLCQKIIVRDFAYCLGVSRVVKLAAIPVEALLIVAVEELQVFGGRNKNLRMLSEDLIDPRGTSLRRAHV
jgi:hypothetical protein